jgi:hypothetical protein
MPKYRKVKNVTPTEEEMRRATIIEGAQTQPAPVQYRIFTTAQRWAKLGGPLTGPFVHEVDINNAEFYPPQEWEEAKQTFGGKTAVENAEQEAEMVMRQRILGELGIEVKFYHVQPATNEPPPPDCPEIGPHWPKR